MPAAESSAEKTAKPLAVMPDVMSTGGLSWLSALPVRPPQGVTAKQADGKAIGNSVLVTVFDAALKRPHCSSRPPVPGR